MKRVLIYIIRKYQRHISPMLPKNCRYIPTCSQYFVQALEKYGAVKGTYLGIKRIIKCNPLFKGGYDPLP